METLLPTEENLWFIPVRTITKISYCYGVLGEFPIQVTLIFQLVSDQSHTW